MIYSVGEVAKIIGITRQRVNQLIKDGRIKATKIGFYWKVKIEDLGSYLDEKEKCKYIY